MAYMHRISARASFSPGKRVLHVRNIDNAKVNIGLQGMLELNTCQRDLCVWANSVLLKKTKKEKNICHENTLIFRILNFVICCIW